MKPWEVRLLRGGELAQMLAVIDARHEVRSRQYAGAGLNVVGEDDDQ